MYAVTFHCRNMINSPHCVGGECIRYGHAAITRRGISTSVRRDDGESSGIFGRSIGVFAATFACFRSKSSGAVV